MSTIPALYISMEFIPSNPGPFLFFVFRKGSSISSNVIMTPIYTLLFPLCCFDHPPCIPQRLKVFYPFCLIYNIDIGLLSYFDLEGFHQCKCKVLFHPNVILYITDSLIPADAHALMHYCDSLIPSHLFYICGVANMFVVSL